MCVCGGGFLGGGISFALLTTDHKNTKGSKDEMGRGDYRHFRSGRTRGSEQERSGLGDGRNPGSSVWISFASGTGD